MEGLIENSQQLHTSSNGVNDSTIQIEQAEANDPLLKLRLTHPQQNVFNFDKVTIASNFDSGNLARCIQSSKNFFSLYISEDCLPYLTNCGNYRTWFYFSVTGVPEGESLTFSIRNMNNQGKLYKSGLKPVYRILPDTQKKWKRVSTNVSYDYCSEGFYVTFSHHFNYSSTENTTYFAFTYPYSYDETLIQSERIVRKFENSSTIYAKREALGLSAEGRVMEILTISGKDKMTKKREELIEGCFPEHDNEKDKRPIIFDKQTVFLTSRVHPGETPASFVLNGILDFITNEDNEQARILRENFVFKVIPILNPDGVYRGYYRLDTKNQNLNRYYLDPTPEGQPTILAAKKAIMQQHSLGKLFLYVDLHAHASKKGCFMFGNALTGEKQLKNMLLAKLVSLNSLNFDFVECSFSEKMMNCKDKKDGLSREGSGRVAMWKATGNPHCYTLECNYATGRRLNHLSGKLNKVTGQIEPESPITDVHSKLYQNSDQKAPPYTIEIFEDVGRAFCIGLLDYIEKNPVSRIPTSNFKNLESIKNDLITHNRILIPRKIEKPEDQLKQQNQRRLSQVVKKPQSLLKKQSTLSSSEMNAKKLVSSQLSDNNLQSCSDGQDNQAQLFNKENIQMPSDCQVFEESKRLSSCQDGGDEIFTYSTKKKNQRDSAGNDLQDDDFFYQEVKKKDNPQLLDNGEQESESEESKVQVEILAQQRQLNSQKPPYVPNKQLVRNLSEKKERIDNAVVAARKRQPFSIRNLNKSHLPNQQSQSQQNLEASQEVMLRDGSQASSIVLSSGDKRKKYSSNDRIIEVADHLLEEDQITSQGDFRLQERGKQSAMKLEKQSNSQRFNSKSFTRQNLNSAGSKSHMRTFNLQKFSNQAIANMNSTQDGNSSQILQIHSKVQPAPITNFRMPTPTTGAMANKSPSDLLPSSQFVNSGALNGIGQGVLASKNSKTSNRMDTKTRLPDIMKNQSNQNANNQSAIVDLRNKQSSSFHNNLMQSQVVIQQTQAQGKASGHQPKSLRHSNVIFDHKSQQSTFYNQQQQYQYLLQQQITHQSQMQKQINQVAKNNSLINNQRVVSSDSLLNKAANNQNLSSGRASNANNIQRMNNGNVSQGQGQRRVGRSQAPIKSPKFIKKGLSSQNDLTSQQAQDIYNSAAAAAE